MPTKPNSFSTGKKFQTNLNPKKWNDAIVTMSKLVIMCGPQILEGKWQTTW